MEQHASGGMWSLMSVSCILLVRNGVETIERELRAIDGVVIAHLPGSELIVAEDGSDEATRAAVERVRGALSLRVVGGAERKGYAETLADAVAAASWPIAFVCDGGLQYDPNEFWRVWEGRERADVVIGRRRETVFRRALALWLRLWFGVPLRDAASGFRIYGRRVRDEILALPRDRAKVFGEIVAMRRKMRTEQKSQAHDLKHVEGGVIDLEFCVQALVLAYGPAHPQLRENKGNHTLLHRAAELGLVDAGIASAAADAYLAMRRRIHAAALNDEETVRLGPAELAPERAAVASLWKALFGG